MNAGLYYPPFSVDKENLINVAPRWMEWINGFEIMLKNCSVQEGDKLQLLLRFVGCDVRDIHNTSEIKEKSFDDLKHGLSEHFRNLSASNLTYQRYAFAWVRQRPGEGFSAFAARVEDAASLCDYKSDNPSKIRDQIVMGCRSDEIRRRAFSHDMSLDDVLSIGNELKDDIDCGLLTPAGDVISVFAPDSALRASHSAKYDPIPSPPHTNGTSDRNKPLMMASSPSEHGNDPTPQFNDLSVREDPKEIARKTKEKARRNEKRRIMRQEAFQAAKEKSFEELTDKQKKFIEYQQKRKQHKHMANRLKRNEISKRREAGGGDGPTYNAFEEGYTAEFDSHQ